MELTIIIIKLIPVKDVNRLLEKHIIGNKILLPQK